MGWDVCERELRCDRDVFWRIVALLVAMANLADVAAGLHGVRRHRVIAILGYGQAAACVLVIDMATGAPALADLPALDELSGDEPEPDCDAAFLAASLRLLALVLAFLLAGWRAPPGQPELLILRCEPAGLPAHCWRAAPLRHAALAAHDTS